MVETLLHKGGREPEALPQGNPTEGVMATLGRSSGNRVRCREVRGHVGKSILAEVHLTPSPTLCTTFEYPSKLPHV